MLKKTLENIKKSYILEKENKAFTIIIMDIVNYSTYFDEEQKEMIIKLQKLIKSLNLTKKYRDDMLFLPTGDGCIIALSEAVKDPIKFCAEIQTTTKKNGLEIRYGMNYGKVFCYRDINLNTNIAGKGINMAARVMDIGDANHILVNGTFEEIFGTAYTRYKKIFHYLGSCKVKHDVKLEIYNIYSKKDGFGNPEIPKKFKDN